LRYFTCLIEFGVLVSTSTPNSIKPFNKGSALWREVAIVAPHLHRRHYIEAHKKTNRVSLVHRSQRLFHVQGTSFVVGRHAEGQQHTPTLVAKRSGPWGRRGGIRRPWREKSNEAAPPRRKRWDNTILVVLIFPEIAGMTLFAL
jgi:hypothetical protein